MVTILLLLFLVTAAPAFANTILILTNYYFTLCFSNFLYNYLFRSLCSDAPKLNIVNFLFPGITNGKRLVFLTSLFKSKL